MKSSFFVSFGITLKVASPFGSFMLKGFWLFKCTPAVVTMETLESLSLFVNGAHGIPSILRGGIFSAARLTRDGNAVNIFASIRAFKGPDRLLPTLVGG